MRTEQCVSVLKLIQLIIFGLIFFILCFSSYFRVFFLFFFLLNDSESNKYSFMLTFIDSLHRWIVGWLILCRIGARPWIVYEAMHHTIIEQTASG